MGAVGGDVDSDLALAMELAAQEEEGYRQYQASLNKQGGHVRVVAASSCYSPPGGTQTAALRGYERELEDEMSSDDDRYGSKSSHEIKKRLLYDHQLERGEHAVTGHDKLVSEEHNAIRLARFEGAGDMDEELPVPDTVYNHLRQHFHGEIRSNRKQAARKSRASPKGPKPRSGQTKAAAAASAGGKPRSRVNHQHPRHPAVGPGSTRASDVAKEWPSLGSAAVMVPTTAKPDAKSTPEQLTDPGPADQAGTEGPSLSMGSSVVVVGHEDTFPLAHELNYLRKASPLSASTSPGVPSTPTDKSTASSGGPGRVDTVASTPIRRQSGKKGQGKKARKSLKQQQQLDNAKTVSTATAESELEPDCLRAATEPCSAEPILIPSMTWAGAEDDTGSGSSPVMVMTDLGGGLVCGSLESRASSDEGWEDVPFFDLDAAGHAVKSPASRPASDPRGPSRGVSPPVVADLTSGGSGSEEQAVPASPGLQSRKLSLTALPPGELPAPTAELEEAREEATRLKQQVTMLQHFGKGQVKRNEMLMQQIEQLKKALAGKKSHAEIPAM